MKIQCVKRKKDAEQQWYVSLPASIVKSLELSKGEEVEWQISDANHLVLSRKRVSEPLVVKQEKKTRQVCSVSLSDFLNLLGI